MKKHFVPRVVFGIIPQYIYVLNHTKIFGKVLTNELEIIILRLSLWKRIPKWTMIGGECCINKIIEIFFPLYSNISHIALKDVSALLENI